MTRFPKILTVTLSLIACAACTTKATSGSMTWSGTHKQAVTSPVSTANVLAVPNPSVWLSDASTFMVIAYLDGIARQERADAEAEAARVEAEMRMRMPVMSMPIPAPPAATPDPAPYVGGIHAQPFLICVRRHESDRSDVNGNGLHDGGYAAKNPSSSAAGAYQYLTSTWNSVVNAMGHPEWAGDPRDFSDDIQDQVAWWTYQNQGAGPWAGSGCG